MGLDKKQLINMVNEFGGDETYWDRKAKEPEDRSKRNEKLGSSNIRAVANICSNTNCYEELKLYIEYKIAKGNGWNEKAVGDKNFGQVVIENMDRIYKDNDENDAEALKQIGLYFGYLYWKKASIEKKKNY